MKIKTLIVGSGISVAGLLLGGFGSSFLGLFASSDAVVYSVKLKPDNSSTTLEVAKNNKCNNGKHKGCLLFEQDKVGIIKFYLKGSKNKIRTCADPETKAVITEIKLSHEGSGGSATDTKGNFGVLPLPSWLKNEAFPGVTLANGVIYQESVATGETQVRLINLNSHDYTAGVKPFWYHIEATECPPGATVWETDPRGDNKGTKY